MSVNCHGRYIGLGPVIMSVREIVVVLADGSLRTASPAQDSELFYAVIGGYNAVAVIVEAELEVAENERLERTSVKLAATDTLTGSSRRSAIRPMPSSTTPIFTHRTMASCAP